MQNHRTDSLPALQSLAVPALGRRSLLGFAALAAAVPLFAVGAYAEPAPAEATATIQRLNAALLQAMKAGTQTSFQDRYTMLAPAIDQAFDLPAVLAVSVGLRWGSLSPDEKSKLLDAFRRYTVASYVANFDKYDGQTFTVSPDARSVAAGEVVVKSKIVDSDGSLTTLGYVMRQTADGWKVVDVLADGSISRVAVQRSDFSSLLLSGGSPALVASLQRKVSDLSGGTLA